MSIPRDRLAWFWALNLVAIPAFSVWGRSLQHLVAGQPGLGLVVLLALAMLVAAGIAWMVGRQGLRGLWHLAWLVPVFVILPASFPVPEERVHFVLFGVFGFLSLRLLPAAIGLALVSLVSGADELLQTFLPDRVGDWADVGTNITAALGGAVLALAGRDDREQGE